MMWWKATGDCPPILAPISQSLVAWRRQLLKWNPQHLRSQACCFSHGGFRECISEDHLSLIGRGRHPLQKQDSVIHRPVGASRSRVCRQCDGTSAGKQDQPFDVRLCNAETAKVCNDHVLPRVTDQQHGRMPANQPAGGKPTGQASNNKSWPHSRQALPNQAHGGKAGGGQANSGTYHSKELNIPPSCRDLYLNGAIGHRHPLGARCCQ